MNSTEEVMLTPVPGQRIHLHEVYRYDLTGFRLSWDADNFGRVSRIPPPEPTGPMLRCNRFATCQSAAYCAAARPHEPDASLDTRAMCYDSRPTPGVVAWGVSVDSRRGAEERKRNTKGEARCARREKTHE